jgi:hypothetical protein
MVTGTKLTGEHLPGWRLDYFVADLVVMACKQGALLDGQNSTFMDALCNRRSGPISAAFAVTIDKHDAGRTRLMDSGNVNAIISAVAGLAGVGTGALLTYLKDKRAERIKDQRDASYLAILVVTHLDRFVSGCLHVAYDDGTSEGQPAGGDGYYRTTVEPPEFAPLDIKVEWRVLPRQLMYDILEIPAKVEHLQNQLAGVMEFDDPPNYGEFFWRRRRDYAKLGLKVSAVAKRLREFAQMPIEEGIPGDWNHDVAMREVLERVDKERAEYERRQAISLD